MVEWMIFILALNVKLIKQIDIYDIYIYIYMTHSKPCRRKQQSLGKFSVWLDLKMFKQQKCALGEHGWNKKQLENQFLKIGMVEFGWILLFPSIEKNRTPARCFNSWPNKPSPIKGRMTQKNRWKGATFVFSCFFTAKKKRSFQDK